MSVRICCSLLVILLVVAAGRGAHTAAGQFPSCFADAPAGPIRGVDNGSSCTFLGIPYAAPPTGALRWKPPQPMSPWTSVFNATAPPPACTANEDCLKLNIWVPDPRPVAAPVIVWLHAGAFIAASANFPSHNGRRLAEETGAIVVAPNYRLGPLGFLAHAALATEDPSRPVSGNYGLLDQRAALRFVRDNIASFGGDPANVTLAGTSAGGDSVGLHLVSPDSAGLFHRAAIHSGTATVRWPTHAEFAVQGDAFATALGCTTPATVLECLRSKTRAEVLSALPLGTQQVMEAPGRVLWQPVVDGWEIPNQPRTLFQLGLFHQVPTIVGFTRDEGWGNFITRSFPSGPSLAQYEAWVGSEFGASAASILARYPASAFASPTEAMARVVADGNFICEAERLARAASDVHAPTFVFSYEHEIDDLSVDHVIHGVESNILFGNPYAPPQFASHLLDAADNALHAAMAGFWTRFAATGVPHTDPVSEVPWPPFKEPIGDGRGSNRYLVLEPAIHPDKRLSETRSCEFWDGFFLRTMLGTVPAGG